MTIGIDKMGFYTPHYVLDMTDLANARGDDPAKYHIGIGQSEMAVVPPTQDVVTMAANATEQILDATDRDQIDLILFATESGIDNSKAGAVYLQHLLKLSEHSRAIEIKQACYSATAALQLGKDYLKAHPGKRVLVIAADIARYGLETAGEITQGGGAVAMIMSENPRILAISDESTYLTRDVMDFWRPVYATEARVDGHYSANVYTDFFTDVWTRFSDTYHHEISDFDAMLFHLPFSKMGLKALRTVLPEDQTVADKLTSQFDQARLWNRHVGNLYTGSLYLSLLSLLAHGDLHAGSQLGLFSYGSGAEGEFFTGTIQADYQEGFDKAAIQTLLDKRTPVSVAEYERIFKDSLPTNGQDRALDISHDSAKYVLGGIKNEQRQYLVQ
ncbi:hydroxymethylglutaryl-CoA synthase [Furfurilactobacillus siliginis]|uniref:3-hydroxy-3-methylglutaryl-CoA synthase n=1 Tax=Furfurilactobacillus siliginis TaxID=348151 RepID=A0A0R2L661_9LACO|nr:hydroxymethylglutaryl-CoA synthase [Furfurilactobacillus siliginis]KRN95397.1 3-hydroxy-3-methylglutaryl-CoA synthase [Furfurilactobacillus siliginis]GEK28177.1 hydroxymethylglutaryl-CoA synthase [Furfurilactobacillus siliginis]